MHNVEWWPVNCSLYLLTLQQVCCLSASTVTLTLFVFMCSDIDWWSALFFFFFFYLQVPRHLPVSRLLSAHIRSDINWLMSSFSHYVWPDLTFIADQSSFCLDTYNMVKKSMSGPTLKLTGDQSRRDPDSWPKSALVDSSEPTTLTGTNATEKERTDDIHEQTDRSDYNIAAKAVSLSIIQSHQRPVSNGPEQSSVGFLPTKPAV